MIGANIAQVCDLKFSLPDNRSAVQVQCAGEAVQEGSKRQAL